MIKAGALYMVVIVSLLIAMISASLLTIAFFYRQEIQKKVRLDKLMINLESGTALLLSEGFAVNGETHRIDLFESGGDSLVLRKERWGIYELNMLKAFELKDTLKRAFLSANAFDDENTIYLADEDRPLSVSGTTQLTGNGQLPKSGLKQAYVDGKPYAGKALINGSITDSSRDLPPLDEALLQGFMKYLKSWEAKETDFKASVKGQAFNVRDTAGNSFFNEAFVYQLDAAQMELGSRKLTGKIILVSDTILHIAADTGLDQVQIYAPAIIVAPGFKGACQLFARDSIIIGKNCVFDYPSFAGVFKQEGQQVQSKISIGEGSRFSGILLSYEKKRSPLQTIISLAKDCKINGEVYATGYVKLERTAAIYGKTYAKRFIMQTPTTLYENYLIDVILNRKMLSSYYLSSSVFKRSLEQVLENRSDPSSDHKPGKIAKGVGRDQKILKWLN